MFFFIFLIFADYVGVIVDATILTRTSICILQEATTFTHYIILLYITYWQYLSTLSVLSRVSLVSMLVILTSIRVMMSLLPMCTRYQVQVSVNVMGTPCLHADCQHWNYVKIDKIDKITHLPPPTSHSHQYSSGVFSCEGKYWSEYQSIHQSFKILTMIHDQIDQQTNMILLVLWYVWQTFICI